MSKAAEKAYQLIRTRIGSGEFTPGMQLTEELLAELCGVSRTPIRDALRRLESEFFVRRADNQRCFVAHWTLDDVQEMFALRAMLEGHAAARASERVNPATIGALRHHNGIIAAVADSQGQLDIEKFLEANRAFHRTLLDAAGSRRLAELLQRLVEQPVVNRTARSYSRDEVATSRREHDELIAAIEAADPSWARAVMTAHIHRAAHAFQRSLDSRTFKSAAE
jgi:DNA-binding GntR family transcriptional regulator